MISDKAQSILQKRNAQAEANRAAMPQCARWLDEVRQVFPDARIVYAEEGGRTMGKKRQGYEVRADQIPMECRTRADIVGRTPVSELLKQSKQVATQEALFA